MVFISNASTAHRLGCPADDCGCFFRFGARPRSKPSNSSCEPQFAPIDKDSGRPWCVCELPEPAWLGKQYPKPWRNVTRALVMGNLNGELLQSTAACS